MSDDDETQADENSTIKQMRDAIDRANAERDEARTERDEAKTARRELAFLKAKVDTDSPVGKLFLKSYDGELTQDAIQDAWKELVPDKPDAPPTPPETDEQRLARLGLANARGNLNAEGSPPGETPEEDPIDLALVEGRAAGPRGSDRAMQAYAQRIIDSAVAGDSRVVHAGPVDHATREAWMEAARVRQMTNDERSKTT